MTTFSKQTLVFALCLALCTIFTATLTSAAGNDIKARMKSRLPAIIALKDKGIIGENNRGYIEFRSDSASDSQLVQQENADRKSVYGAIAKQQGGPIEAVESSGARNIAQRGKKGHWFQKPDGTWYRK